MISDYLYSCDYCHKKFKGEGWFMRHECKEMKRDKDFKSLEGQASFLFYKEWMRCKHKQGSVRPESFKNSQFFNSFMKFVEFTKKVKLPDNDLYISLMVTLRIDPANWTNALAYGKYLEHITRVLSAEKLIEITVTTLFDIADEHKTTPTEIFNVLVPNDIIQLLHQRRISPWILLNSKKFSEFFRTHTNPEERVIMESLINPDYWIKRFQSHPNDLQLAKDCVTALHL